MRTTHVLVEGLVQGVCFRDYTRRQALALNLTGWVRNLADGSVEAMLCGAPEDVNSMLNWLQRGSPRSQVDRVRAEELAGEQHFPTFDIRY